MTWRHLAWGWALLGRQKATLVLSLLLPCIPISLLRGLPKLLKWPVPIPRSSITALLSLITALTSMITYPAKTTAACTQIHTSPCSSCHSFHISIPLSGPQSYQKPSEKLGNLYPSALLEKSPLPQDGSLLTHIIPCYAEHGEMWAAATSFIICLWRKTRAGRQHREERCCSFQYNAPCSVHQIFPGV